MRFHDQEGCQQAYTGIAHLKKALRIANNSAIDDREAAALKPRRLAAYDLYARLMPKNRWVIMMARRCAAASSMPAALPVP